MKALVSFLLFLLLHITAGAEDSQPRIKIGERGDNQSVFDPAGVLTTKEQDRISRPLQEIFQNEGIDVLVLILPEIGDAPPEHLVAGFAEKWAKAKINAVVLYVPGREGSPWIFPGEMMSAVLKPAALKEAIEEAQKRAAAEPTDLSKVRAASIEAADAMRYWAGGALLRTEVIIGKRLEWQLANERRERLIKLAAALAAAAVIPLVVGIFLLRSKIKNCRPLHFPAMRKMSRLGAPYSGGNDVCTKPIR